MWAEESDINFTLLSKMSSFKLESLYTNALFEHRRITCSCLVTLSPGAMNNPTATKNVNNSRARSKRGLQLTAEQIQGLFHLRQSEAAQIMVLLVEHDLPCISDNRGRAYHWLRWKLLAEGRVFCDGHIQGFDRITRVWARSKQVWHCRRKPLELVLIPFKTKAV